MSRNVSASVSTVFHAVSPHEESSENLAFVPQGGANPAFTVPFHGPRGSALNLMSWSSNGIIGDDAEDSHFGDIAIR